MACFYAGHAERLPGVASLCQVGRVETLILSASPRFWELSDKAGAGPRTPLESLPGARRRGLGPARERRMIETYSLISTTKV